MATRQEHDKPRWKRSGVVSTQTIGEGGALHDAKVVRDGVWVGQICTPASRWIVVGAVVVRIHLSSHKATV